MYLLPWEKLDFIAKTYEQNVLQAFCTKFHAPFPKLENTIRKKQYKRKKLVYVFNRNLFFDS